MCIAVSFFEPRAQRVVFVLQKEIFYNISFSLLSVLFLLFLSASIGFILGIGINGLGIFLALVLGIGAPVFLKISDIKKFLLSFTITLGIIAFSLYVSDFMLDVSFDALWYHQPAAFFLKKGWNPVYVRVSDFLTAHWTIKGISSLPFIESYPKASEIISACIFYLTDNIETGKAVNLIASAALFFYSLYIFTVFFDCGILRFFLSFAVIINPIVLAQIHTGYVDGLVYVFFMFALLSIIELEKTDRRSKSGLLIFIMSVTLLAGIKVSSGLYATEIILFYLIYLKYHKKHFEKSGAICFAIAALLFITNINPYLTNLYQGKHLFYPIMGKEKIDLMTENTPTFFFNHSMPYKLFMSLFTSAKNSASENPETNTPIKIKIPFTYSDEEKIDLGAPDLRLSGFGIWWGGILCLSLTLLPFTWKILGTDGSLYRLIMLILITSVLTFPENWWARFIPQLYAIPFFIVLFFTIKGFSVYRYSFASVLLFIMTANSLFTYMEVVSRTIPQINIRKDSSPVISLDAAGRPSDVQIIPALMLNEKHKE